VRVKNDSDLAIIRLHGLKASTCRATLKDYKINKSIRLLAIFILVIFLSLLIYATSHPEANTAGEVVLVGAGDISSCDNDNDEATAKLVDEIPGTVFVLGDNVYLDGTAEEFATCYHPTWGRHKERTMPVPGNHEYFTVGAAGYFQYFDDIPSYYAYDLGPWRIYALNSEIDVSSASEQVQWLRNDLEANPRLCVLAYWHKPVWSSRYEDGKDSNFETLWEIFYSAGAELIVNGHIHNYERFAEMDANGSAASPGLREIVVGTGGVNLDGYVTRLPTSEVRNASTYGVLKLTLSRASYSWQFIPIAGESFTDSGTTHCH
jgi:hypothetical protein